MTIHPYSTGARHRIPKLSESLARDVRARIHRHVAPDALAAAEVADFDRELEACITQPERVRLCLRRIERYKALDRDEEVGW